MGELLAELAVHEARGRAIEGVPENTEEPGLGDEDQAVVALAFASGIESSRNLAGEVTRGSLLVRLLVRHRVSGPAEAVVHSARPITIQVLPAGSALGVDEIEDLFEPFAGAFVEEEPRLAPLRDRDESSAHDQQLSAREGASIPEWGIRGRGGG